MSPGAALDQAERAYLSDSGWSQGSGGMWSRPGRRDAVSTKVAVAIQRGEGGVHVVLPAKAVLHERSSRTGPTLSCSGCAHERLGAYLENGSVGATLSCGHANGRGYVGKDTVSTPDWCPYLAADKGRTVLK